MRCSSDTCTTRTRRRQAVWLSALLEQPRRGDLQHRRSPAILQPRQPLPACYDNGCTTTNVNMAAISSATDVNSALNWTTRYAGRLHVCLRQLWRVSSDLVTLFSVCKVDGQAAPGTVDQRLPGVSSADLQPGPSAISTCRTSTESAKLLTCGEFTDARWVDKQTSSAVLRIQHRRRAARADFHLSGLASATTTAQQLLCRQRQRHSTKAWRRDHLTLP